MSSAEYWHGDPSLVKGFRKAFKMKQERENTDAWLHGLYVYDALCSAMSHLNTNKSLHKSYTDKPYSFDAKQNEEEKVIEAQAQAEVWMKSWAAATQRMFEEK